MMGDGYWEREFTHRGHLVTREGYVPVETCPICYALVESGDKTSHVMWHELTDTTRVPLPDRPPTR